MERAVNAGGSHVTASISASNAHSQRNAGLTLYEARRQFSEMVVIGKKSGLTVRGGIQCAFGCRYEGRIDVSKIAAISRSLEGFFNRRYSGKMHHLLNREDIEIIC